MPTIGAAYRAAVRPRWQKVLFAAATASPRVKMVALCFYFLLSAKLFWAALGKFHAIPPISIAVSVFLSAGILLALRLILPASVLRVIACRASGIMKLSLALNVFTALVIFQMFVTAHFSRALFLTIEFVVVWSSIFVLYRYVVGVLRFAKDFFLGVDDRFDSTTPQGRHVRLE